MAVTYEQVQRYLLGPLVSQWIARLEAAKTAKKRFTACARLCRQFYGTDPGAQWGDDVRNEFYPQVPKPQFAVSINKAFELVSVIGPSLLWRYPRRQVRSIQPPSQVEILQTVFGVQDEAFLQQMSAMEQTQAATVGVRNRLLERVLNHLADKHPTGTCLGEAQLVVQDAMVAGLGLLWTETYVDKASGQPMVTSFAGRQDELLVDPDCRDATRATAKWISRTHVEPVWVVERRFGYPPGYLSGKGTGTSSEWAWQASQTQTAHKYYQDMIEWTEIWSCGGIGARVQGIDPAMGEALDAVAGEYCYLAISKNVPHPLNLPPTVVEEAPPDLIRQALLWRTSRFGAVCEFWKDRRWPCEFLEFYPLSGSPWPIAPLAPGLPFLLSMNILLVSQLQMSYDRRRDIIGVYEHMAQQVNEALNSESTPCVVKLTSAAQQSIGEVMQFLQRPPVQGDLLMWIQYLDQQFQKATGLDDLSYGISQRQSRVVADVQMRQQKSAVRPEKMSLDVADFLRRSAQKELWLTAMYLPGDALVPLLGMYGAQIWEQQIRTIPFEVMVRQFDTVVEVTEMHRPDNDKEIQDHERILPFLLPVLQGYAQSTGDTAPLNALLQRYFTAMQLTNPSAFAMQGWSQRPDPAATQMQQAMTQAQLDRLAAETEDTRAKAVARLTDAQYKSQGSTASGLQRLRFAELDHQQRMRQADEAHLQNMLITQERSDLEQQYVR